jgi:multidrug efflux system membrane fusion protein
MDRMTRLLRYSLFTLALAACSKSVPQAEAPVPVEVARVAQKTLPERLDAVGTVEAINAVAVKSRVDGQLLESDVKDGDDVHKGQLLFRIDPRPAQAVLAQTQAALAKDEAARDLALAQVNRYEPVARKGFISADQMQQYRTAYSAAAASVKVDQANVEAAKLALGYTDIFAPFAGRAGRILVQPGNLVKANDTQALLTINQLKPIFVNFALPGRFVERVRAAQAGAPLEVAASGESLKTAQSGQVAFVDNAVDPATNTVKLRASFSNDNESLWPGQFVNIALTLGSDANALVVPSTAIKDGPNGSYVFVVKADGRAEQRNVTVARSVSGESMISNGLSVDETVITDGQSRVVDGAKVKVVPAAASR